MTVSSDDSLVIWSSWV